MLELFMQPEAWVIFATLFALEVVLGVDNVVFISVLCERLPSHQRKLARNLGIGLAVLARIDWCFLSHGSCNLHNHYLALQTMQ